jgi:hypothetical protein
MSVVSCRACGAPIDQDLDAPDGTRAPCSQCGAAVRTFDVHQTEAVLLSDYRKRHIKSRGAKGRPSKEEIDGDDLWRKAGRWMHLTRTIDRARDWYSEKVVDPRTGEVVHQCEGRSAPTAAAGQPSGSLRATRS